MQVALGLFLSLVYVPSTEPKKMPSDIPSPRLDLD
jgi:hypothetical protein